MNDTEMNIRRFIPELINLGGDNVLDWIACEATFLKVRAENAAAGKEGQPVEANIYEIILAVKKSNIQAYRFINFFDQILGTLNLLLDTHGKRKITKSLANIFTAHDHKFLNFIGELIILTKMLQSRQLLLNNVEVKIANGKSIDFEFVNLSKGNRLDLLEVHNVHLDDDRVQANDEKLYKFYHKRLWDKMTETKLGLPEGIEINLMQVYWGSYESLRTYGNFFKKYSVELRQAEPLAFKTVYNSSHPLDFTHYYGRVHKLFGDDIDNKYL